MAYPYLKYVTSKCCYGLPFFQPYDGEESNNLVHDEEEQPLNQGSNTYFINGKEYKKRSKKPKKKQLSEKATDSEPLAQLGFGIVAYTGMLYYMIWAFAFYTLLLIPTFIFYGKGTAYDNVGDQSKLGYAPKTLGALGYSSYQCNSIPYSVGTYSFSCEYGTVGTVTSYGVNPGTARGTCMVLEDVNDACQLTNTDFIDSTILSG